MSNEYLDFVLKEIINHEVDETLNKIKAEIENYVCSQEENTMKAEGMLNALKIIDKYIVEKTGKYE